MNRSSIARHPLPARAPQDRRPVGASVGYRFFFDGSSPDLILRGTNLTDQEARSYTSFVKDDVPLPGPNVSLIRTTRIPRRAVG